MDTRAREVQSFAWRTSTAIMSITFWVLERWVEVFLGAVGALRYRPLTDFAGSMRRLVGGAVIVELTVFLCAALFFLVWVHRAATNTGALDPEAGLDSSDVLFMWMVPLANLVVPYQHMKTICRVTGAWRAGHGIGDHAPGSTWPRRWVLPLWWASWWTGWLTSSLHGGRRSAPLWLGLHLPSDVALTVAAVLVVHLISRIDEVHETAARRSMA